MVTVFSAQDFPQWRRIPDSRSNGCFPGVSSADRSSVYAWIWNACGQVCGVRCVDSNEVESEEGWTP